MKPETETRLLWLTLLVVLAAAITAGLIFGVPGALAGVTAMLAFVLAILIELRRAVASRTRRMKQQLKEIRDEVAGFALDAAGVAFLQQALPVPRPLPAFHSYSIRADFAAILAAEALSRDAPAVVELGSGVSTVVLALCLKKLGAGSLLSLDQDEAYAARTRSLLAEYQTADVADVRFAPLTQVNAADRSQPWYSVPLSELPASIDILVVDGPTGATGPLARYPALPLLYDRLAPGAVIYLDDGSRAQEAEVAERWQREYPSLARIPLTARSGVIAFRKL
jgi:predicted O-methyltransferase YrrM